MKRIFITGLSGFVGEYLGDFLRREGFQVSGSSYQSPPRRGSPEISRVDVTDSSAVFQRIRQVNPQAIIHLAAESNPKQAMLFPERVMRVNVDGTLNLLEAVRRIDPGIRFLFVSSSHVYGETSKTKKTVKETDLCYPREPYGVSKYLAELACLDYVNHFGLDVVIARPFNHFGAKQSPSYVFSGWAKQIAENEKDGRGRSVRTGNLDVRRDFLHVKDVARAYALLLKKGKTGKIYNIASGRALSLRRYAEYLLTQSKVPSRTVADDSLIRQNEVSSICGDNQKIRELGWKVSVDVFEGLREVLDYWRKVQTE